MKTPHITSEILNNKLRRDLIFKLLRFVIPISIFLAITGVVTNVLGEMHWPRLILNLFMLFMIVFIHRCVHSQKLFLAINTFLISGVIVCVVSTLVNGGVVIPNYAGFLVLITIASTFSTLRTTVVICILFIVVGGVSLLLPFRIGPATLPSPLRYWIIYSFFGVALMSVVMITRRAFNETIMKVASRESLLSSIFSSTSDALIILDDQGQIAHMNPSAQQLNQKILDVHQQGILEISMFNLDSEKSSSLIDQLDLSSEVSQTLNVNLITKSYRAWYLITASPQILEERRVGTVVSIHNSTAQHDLAHAQKMNAIGVLANGVAHDFNNMLGAISNATALLTPVLPSTYQETLKVLEEATRRSSELTHQLMLFSRHQSTQLQKVNIHKLLEDVSLLLKHIIHDTSSSAVSLEFTSKRVWVEGNESQLHSIFMNLGVNALQAMGSGGLLKFRTYDDQITQQTQRTSRLGETLKDGSFLCVEVIDEGEGIEPEVLNHMFEPFFTKRGIGEGSGLGLAAVYGTVERHGGMIDVQSEIGSGTVFSIFLPLIKVTDIPVEELSASSRMVETPVDPELTPPLVSDQEIKNSVPTYQKTLRVLVIDDERIVRHSLERMLKAMGFIALSAESGDIGLEILRELSRNSSSCDLILLDMLMPHKNGREVFYEIKAEYPLIPIVLSSGFAPEEIVEELLSKGLKGILRKPYPPSELRAMIDKVIQST